MFTLGTIAGISSFILVPLLAMSDFSSAGDRPELLKTTNDD
ncbi:MAG: hypothetical protein PHO20_03475 [Candidatus Peribacteraceae bacterium]|nr:hypothetical protein [Candidatus Peribacteraceae bacterium]